MRFVISAHNSHSLLPDTEQMILGMVEAPTLLAAVRKIGFQTDPATRDKHNRAWAYIVPLADDPRALRTGAHCLIEAVTSIPPLNKNEAVWSQLSSLGFERKCRQSRARKTTISRPQKAASRKRTTRQ